jgi:hypothetical protein
MLSGFFNFARFWKTGGVNPGSPTNAERPSAFSRAA